MPTTEPEIQLNIALVPEERIQKQAIKLSELLQKHLETEFTLNKNNRLPHLTISQARYPKRNLEKVITLIKKQAQTQTSFPIELNTFNLILGQFVFWNAVRAEALVSFHTQVVNATNLLREGLIIEHIATMKNLSPQDENDRKKYGALLIGSRYIPHVTLTRLKSNTDLKQVTKIIGEYKSEKSSLSKSKLIIGYLGDHGTVNQIIEEIPLEK